jgi:hypothetical protein
MSSAMTATLDKVRPLDVGESGEIRDTINSIAYMSSVVSVQTSDPLETILTYLVSKVKFNFFYTYNGTFVTMDFQTR